MAWLSRRPVLLLLLTAAFWGGNLVAGKLAVHQIDPYVLTVLRWFGSFLIVLPFAIGSLRRDVRIIMANLPLLLAYGAIGYCAFNILIYVAVGFTAGVNAAIEQVSVNIFVICLNFALFRMKVSLGQAIGVVMTVIGVAITATHGDLAQILDLTINVGDSLIILACLLYAVYSIMLRYRPALSWISFVTVTTIGAAIAAIFSQGVLGDTRLIAEVASFGPEQWLIVLYVVLFPSVLAQMLYARGVELIGANRASLFMNLIPVFGAFGSILVLGERLHGFQVVAGGLIISGIVLAEWFAQRGPRPAR